jgi:hypothetical protein
MEEKEGVGLKKGRSAKKSENCRSAEEKSFIPPIPPLLPHFAADSPPV